MDRLAHRRAQQVEDILSLLLESWREISEEAILSAWNVTTEALLGDIDAIPEDDGDNSPLYFEI